ncbi:MAG: hypothetical protein RR664_02120, partial [Clostridia bacterium]
SVKEVCKVCKAEISNTEIKATGHSFGEYKVVKEATCSEEGLEEANCNTCNKVDSKVIPVKAHDVEKITVAPTCEKAGSVKEVCKVCKTEISNTEIKATGHSFGEYKVVKEATCSEQGLEEAKCNHCDKTDSKTIAVKAHDVEKITVAPTCEKAGSVKEVCKVCKAEISNTEIKATGHSFGEYKVVKEATCSEQGLEEAKCNHCDKTDSKTIAVKAHDVEKITVAPTCEKAGSVKEVCKVCKAEISNTETKATGHSFSEWTNVVKAEIGKDGKDERTCTECNAKESRVLSALVEDPKPVYADEIKPAEQVEAKTSVKDELKPAEVKKAEVKKEAKPEVKALEENEQGLKPAEVKKAEKEETKTETKTEQEENNFSLPIALALTTAAGIAAGGVYLYSVKKSKK